MTISQPDTTINLVSAPAAIENQPQKVLLVGQKNGGTATSGALVQNIGNDGSENSLFGEDSLIAGMVRAFKAINTVSQLDVISLDDNGGATAATGTVVVAGSATAAGTLVVTVGSDKNHKYTITVASGDSATVIGDAIETAVNADSKVPVTAANVTGTVTMTAVNGGTVANTITLRITGEVSGITTSTTAMSGGATDPVLTTLFDPIDGLRYQTVVLPGTYATSNLTDLLDPRFNTNNDILDGVGIQTITDTFSNIESAANALNSQSIVIIGNQIVSDTADKGSAIVELNDVISSEFAAIRALRLTTDADISRYVISTGGARDSFGGSALASFPYFNTPFFDLPLIPQGNQFTRTEIESLTTAGASTLSNNIANNQLILGEVPTTYKTDAGGNPDPTWKFLNYVDTSSNIREYFFNNLRARFAQSRLTEGDVIPNRSMANAAIIGAYMDKLYQDLSGEDFVLTQAGETARNFFKNNRTISLDLSTGKVTASMKVPIVTQLRQFVATMQIVFSTNS